jgi:hypothetical protein
MLVRVAPGKRQRLKPVWPENTCFLAIHKIAYECNFNHKMAILSPKRGSLGENCLINSRTCFGPTPPGKPHQLSYVKSIFKSPKPIPSFLQLFLNSQIVNDVPILLSSPRQKENDNLMDVPNSQFPGMIIPSQQCATFPYRPLNRFSKSCITFIISITSSANSAEVNLMKLL